MTVVAQGAAIFSGGVLRDEPKAVPERSGVNDVRVELRFDPVSEDLEALVGGRIVGPVPTLAFTVEIERTDGRWSSSRIPVANGTFVTTVSLEPRSANSFNVRVFDPGGLPVRGASSEFAITHGIVVDEPPLSRPLGVAVEENEGPPRTKVLIEHGARLPATGRHSFRTTRALVPGQTGGINLHIVEGSSSRADRNDHVGFIRLDGRNVQRPVPVSSEVDITLSVDPSRRLSVEAFVPLLDETFRLTVSDMNRPTPDLATLRQQLEVEEERLSRVGAVASLGEAPSLVRDTHHALQEAEQGDQDAAMKAQRRLRELQTQLDSASDVAELPLLEAQWRDTLPRVREMLAEYSDPSRQQRLVILEREGDEAIAAANPAQLRQRIEDLSQLYWGILTEQDGWWIGFYQHLVERQEEMADQPTARMVVQQGRAALNMHDFEALRKACRTLWELLPATGDSKGLPDVGIRA
jgi:molecular chaperone DnaK